MIGLLRIKDEARWIKRVLESITPVCSHVIVMDDHSTDGTREIAASVRGVEVIESPFLGLDECRDKNWLLGKARDADWVLMIDGDEILDAAGIPNLVRAMAMPMQCYSLRVLYLWDNEHQVRMDGVYGKFHRASMFRPGDHSFVGTGFGGNFHCGNAPVELQHRSHMLDASLLHLGYMEKADRLRKFEWYNRLDPQNRSEDGYRHIVQGDLPEVPAAARLKHAGPLQLEAR